MKKGVSEIVSFVLLIGFVVSLGVLVTTWFKEQTEKTTTTLVKETIGDIRCSDVSLNAYFINPPACDRINITNTGYFRILQVTVRSQFGSRNYNLEINITESKDLNIGGSFNEVEIIPIIKSEKELVACADRKVSIKC